MQIINWLTSDPTHITTVVTIIATILSFLPGKVGEIGKRIGVNVTKSKPFPCAEPVNDPNAPKAQS